MCGRSLRPRVGGQFPPSILAQIIIIRFRDVTGSRSRKKFCWEQKRFREKMAARGARQMPRTGARARITEQNLITA